MTAGRLAALERTLRTVAGDVEAIGYMTGPGAVPIPWYAHLDVDKLALLDGPQRDLLAAWHAEVVPDASLDVVEVRLVTPTCGYLMMRRFQPFQLEWVARDDLPRWPL